MRVLKKDLIAKVAQLESDLMELVINPDSERSWRIRVQQAHKAATERMMWMGSVKTSRRDLIKTNYDGFLNKLK